MEGDRGRAEWEWKVEGEIGKKQAIGYLRSSLPLHSAESVSPPDRAIIRKKCIPGAPAFSLQYTNYTVDDDFK